MLLDWKSRQGKAGPAIFAPTPCPRAGSWTIVSRSPTEFGDNSMSNLQAVCSQCHNNKTQKEVLAKCAKSAGITLD